MAGRRALGLGILLLTGSVAMADGYWTWCHSPARPIIACPPVPCPPYAVPMPAPPSTEPALPGPGPGQAIPKGSSSKEPPIGNTQSKRPVINTDRSVGGVPQNAEQWQAKCKVSFWNMTGADIELFVEGKSYRVGKDRAQVLTLDRQFNWRHNNFQEKHEVAADDSNYFEVPIR